MLRLTRAKVTLAGLALAGGAAAAAVLGPAGPAIGQSSPPLVVQIQVNSPATVVARGAALDVSVTIECSGLATGTTPFVSVSVTESVGGKIATGNADVSPVCTGTSQNLLMVVTAQAGKAFKKGAAVANGSIEGCDFTTCETAQDQPTIAIS